MDSISIDGVITKIYYPKNNKNNKYITIQTKENENYVCIGSGFLPIRVCDIISCELKKDGDKYTFIKEPFIIINESSEYILSIFKKATKNLLHRSSMEFFKMLVDSLGNGVFEFMCEFSEKIIKGDSIPVEYLKIIKNETINSITYTWYKDVLLRRLYLLGLNNTEIFAIQEVYDEEDVCFLNNLYKDCIKNPLQFFQIHIDKCEKIILNYELDYTEEEISLSLLKRNLAKKLTINNMCYVVKEEVDVSIKELLPKNDEEYSKLKILNENKEGRFVLQSIYNKILYISMILSDKIRNEKIYSFKNINFFYKELDDQQRNAVSIALNNGISIITGYAGTGKTTVIKEIIKQLDKINLYTRILSFTGKAVARIKEVCEELEADYECSTIHKYICKGGRKFKYMIIDETSMVNVTLMYKLLKVLEKKQTIPNIILIGDPNQLPPINNGSFFSEIVNIKEIPKVNLTNVHRIIMENDGIIKNSLEIILSKSPVLSNCDNFKIIKNNESYVKKIVSSLKKEGIESKDFVIISPYNENINSFNVMCQNIYCEGSYIVDKNKRHWYVGDKVMMLENNYKIDVMNGDEGIVEDIEKEYISVMFNGIVHKFGINYDKIKTGLFVKENKDFKEDNVESLSCGELNHSYAITIHKSQGSEWKYVIIYLPNYNISFLNRNLLYTAITRARLAVWIVVEDLEIDNIASRKIKTDNKLLLDIYNKKLGSVQGESSGSVQGESSRE